MFPGPDAPDPGGLIIETPAPILRYLHSRLFGARFPAYLMTGPDGRIAVVGGAVERYGLAGTEPGDRAANIDLLSSLLPPGDEPRMLPCIGLDGFAPADVHSIPSAEGVWFLLLDATAERKRREQLHQAVNELQLLRGQLLREARPEEGGGGAENHTIRREVSALALARKWFRDGSETVDGSDGGRFGAWRAAVERSLEGRGALVVSWVGEAVLALFGAVASRPSPVLLALEASLALAPDAPGAVGDPGAPVWNTAGLATGPVVLTLSAGGGAPVRCFGAALARALWLGQIAEDGSLLVDRRSRDALSATAGSTLEEFGPEPLHVYRYGRV